MESKILGRLRPMAAESEQNLEHQAPGEIQGPQRKQGKRSEPTWARTPTFTQAVLSLNSTRFKETLSTKRLIRSRIEFNHTVRSGAVGQARSLEKVGQGQVLAEEGEVDTASHDGSDQGDDRSENEAF